MKKLIMLALALVLALPCAACDANLSDEEVVEKAQSAAVEGHPGTAFVTAFEEAVEKMSQEMQETDGAAFAMVGSQWNYGWPSIEMGLVLESSLEKNERPLTCTMHFGETAYFNLNTGELVGSTTFNVVLLEFKFDTKRNILVPDGGFLFSDVTDFENIPGTAGDTSSWDADEASDFIAYFLDELE